MNISVQSSDKTIGNSNFPPFCYFFSNKMVEIQGLRCYIFDCIYLDIFLYNFQFQEQFLDKGSLVKYRKLPLRSPVLIQLRKGFWVDL